ncbi:MAG: cysteine desulfurase [Deltaproteobacteria bacterium]|nr:cysteine desulfurase [Deltaproteobacteria bacterium]
MKIINLVHLSANPALPEVQEAMIEVIKNNYGNPSSQHSMGDAAATALEAARDSVSALINCQVSKEIVFTSGGTESGNHAVKGVAFAKADKGKHIITSCIEHSSVIRSANRLKLFGFSVTSLPVDKYGMVDPAEVEAAIQDDTILISIMHSNNEIGTIQPIKEIGKIAKERRVLFHSDAVDSVGVIPVDVQDLDVDLLSFSSNPYYGPSGAGGLYIKRGTAVWPLFDGGVQENNKRAGTENMIGIVGMGKAAEIAKRDMDKRIAHSKRLKDKFLRDLPAYLDEYILNGHPEMSLPNHISISLKYIEGESVVLMLDEEGIAVSTRSACAAGSLRASQVLLAIAHEFADAQGTMVITFGMDNTEEDVDRLLKALKHTVVSLREISPLYKK